MMSETRCAYCLLPAIAVDLCHASHPVCAAHIGTGHQIATLAPAPAKERKPTPK